MQRQQVPTIWYTIKWSESHSCLFVCLLHVDFTWPSTKIIANKIKGNKISVSWKEIRNKKWYSSILLGSLWHVRDVFMIPASFRKQRTHTPKWTIKMWNLLLRDCLRIEEIEWNKLWFIETVSRSVYLGVGTSGAARLRFTQTILKSKQRNWKQRIKWSKFHRSQSKLE